MEREIRDFRSEDLEWIKPIAEKYGEWMEMEAVLRNRELYRVRQCLVICPLAMMALFEDEHGFIAGGVCDTIGIKAFLVIARVLDEYTKEFAIRPIHAHAEQGTWQFRAYEKFGYIGDSNGMLWRQ